MAEILVAYTGIKIISEYGIEGKNKEKKERKKKLLMQNHPSISKTEFSVVPELTVEV